MYQYQVSNIISLFKISFSKENLKTIKYRLPRVMLGFTQKINCVFQQIRGKLSDSFEALEIIILAKSP